MQKGQSPIFYNTKLTLIYTIEVNVKFCAN